MTLAEAASWYAESKESRFTALPPSFVASVRHFVCLLWASGRFLIPLFLSSSSLFYFFPRLTLRREHNVPDTELF